MSKQTTVRLPKALADEAELVARVRGLSVNKLIIEALTNEIEAARVDESFRSKASELVDRDLAVLARLATRRRWSADDLFEDLEPPTDDDVPVAADGRRLDTADKVAAFVDELNEARDG